jgi:hypothetical protein
MAKRKLKRGGVWQWIFVLMVVTRVPTFLTSPLTVFG